MSDFDPYNSLGNRSPEEIGAFLIDIGDEEGASHLNPGVSGQAFHLGARAIYLHTGCVLGFIPAVQPTGVYSQVLPGSSVTGDRSLIGQRIKISLDKFFLNKYPGGRGHTILCEFSGKNQVAQAEELRFAMRFQNNNRGSAGMVGKPIFLGVTVGEDGISFLGKTVHVSGSGDEMILQTLDSDAFKNGLSLLTQVQPVIKPFAALATSAVAMIAKRRSNSQIHSFDLGLDFSNTATSLRLQEGSYVVVQCDEPAKCSWTDYHWNHNAQGLESKVSAGAVFPYNYMVFGVSKMGSTGTI